MNFLIFSKISDFWWNFWFLVKFLIISSNFWLYLQIWVSHSCLVFFYYFCVHSHAIKVGWSVQVHFGCGLIKISYIVWLYLSSIHSKPDFSPIQLLSVSVLRLLGLSRWPKVWYINILIYQYINVWSVRPVKYFRTHRPYQFLVCLQKECKMEFKSYKLKSF